MRLPVDYRKMLSHGEIAERAEALERILAECRLCPHACGADRLKGEFGVCRSTDRVVIASAGPHYGEEPPLVGSNGSGTIFFSSCNLKCQFCQNYEISQLRSGRPVSTEELARIMLHLQDLGCHNINLVTPTHVIPQIVRALAEATGRGLSIPIVYNCGGYESLEVVKMLEGIVDIYMPDIKYAENATARTLSGAPGYWDVVRPVVKEMHRQVGDLELDDRGVALRGLLVRHLVLPEGRADSARVFQFISREVSPTTYVNIMDQYRPAYRIGRHPGIARRIKSQEYLDALKSAERVGLHRGFPHTARHFALS